MSQDPKKEPEITHLCNMVETWEQYWRYNNQRFWQFYKIAYGTTLNMDEIGKLQALNKPPLEFNIFDGMISRLLGEFAQHMPSFEVRRADGVPPYYASQELDSTIQLVEGFLRALFNDATNDSLKYKFYRDCLIGGFSVGEVLTEYLNPMSFEQVIKIERVFDPTLTFFDPMSRLTHKGDGMYCGKLVPFEKQDFIDTFGSKPAANLRFSRSGSLEGFNWSYANQKQEVILVASMFKKIPKKMKIVRLSNGHTVPIKHYEMLLEKWTEAGIIEQPPRVIGKPRETEVETIQKIDFCQTEILHKETTDYGKFPIVYIDGNSSLMRGQDMLGTADAPLNPAASTTDSIQGATTQFTKPYIYAAYGMQKLKNFAGQTIASELSNIVQHQYIASLESIPPDPAYVNAYTNPQIANVLVYNQFYDKNPDVSLNPPQILQRREIPPLIESVFLNADKEIQMILNTHDAALNTDDNQLSGVALQQGALQSNAAALPYFMGFNNGLNRMAEIVIDIMPKYYKTPRTLPIVGTDGKRTYEAINTKNGGLSTKFDPNHLEVSVKLGVSSNVQKQIALEMIIKMMAASEEFNKFINQAGMQVILDNMDIRGVEHLKYLWENYSQQQAQAAEQAKNQPTEAQQLLQTEKEIAFAEIEQRREKDQGDQANKAVQLAIERQKLELQFVEMLYDVQADEAKAQAEVERAASEEAQKAIEMIIDLAKSKRE